MKRVLYRKFVYSTDIPLRFYDRLRQGYRFVFRKRALYDRNRLTTMLPPFFIIGSGRSGNTLLRALLASHSRIAIPPESYVLNKAIRLYRAYSHLPWPIVSYAVLTQFEQHPDFDTWEVNIYSVLQKVQELPEKEKNLRNILESLYCEYGEATCQQFWRWGDKTPANTLHLPRITKVFPDAQFIHIIRDGRDVVASYLNSGIYTSLEDAADRWKTSLNLASHFGNRMRDNQYLVIRYEDLVRDPYTILNTICMHLDISFEQDMLRFYVTPSYLGDVSRHQHHMRVKQPIDDSSIGKWKQRLSAEQIETLSSLLGSTLEKCGYVV